MALLALVGVAGLLGGGCKSGRTADPPRVVDVHDGLDAGVTSATSDGASASSGLGGGGGAGLRAVAHAELCVTHGSIEAAGGARLRVTHPKMRAVVGGVNARAAELRFTYLGPTDHDEALGSGQIRRQIGLKLRAANSCNVVYAMWRIEPESKLVVSVKANPGMRTHAECGTKGYTNIKPEKSRPVPLLTPGASHVLRAEMDRDRMTVTVDGAPVWEGALGEGALAFDGPVGVRTDNGRFDVDMFASAPDSAATLPKGSPCTGESSEEP